VRDMLSVPDQILGLQYACNQLAFLSPPGEHTTIKTMNAILATADWPDGLRMPQTHYNLPNLAIEQ
jgi:hypothetical protein